MKLAPLYKLSNVDKLQIWQISVNETEEGYGLITTSWGQEDGVWQHGEDTVREGKNAGKKNATTPLQQAEAEAKSKWTKQIERRGYVEDRERALAKETDAEGGIAPMLAKPLEETKKIVFPCDAQRKYNGVRLIAQIEDGTVSLWSRGRTRVLGFPHIEAAYRAAFAGTKGSFLLDGEAYRHGWSLQRISGYSRVDEPKEGHEEVGHYVYDYPSYEGPWREREFALSALLHGAEAPINLVARAEAASMEDVKRLHDQWVSEGYEGAILRNLKAPYEAGKRSYQLAKYKEYEEREFKIVGIGEGRGKFEGKAVFTCATNEGKEFDCCAPGTLEDRAEFLRRGDELIGKPLTVKFFEWSDEGKPLQPVGIAVRDYE